MTPFKELFEQKDSMFFSGLDRNMRNRKIEAMIKRGEFKIIHKTNEWELLKLPLPRATYSWPKFETTLIIRGIIREADEIILAEEVATQSRQQAAVATRAREEAARRAEAAAQAAAEALAREAARLNVDAEVAECAYTMANERTDSAQRSHDQAVRDTIFAKGVLADLNPQATLAAQQVQRASDHMVRAKSHWSSIEEIARTMDISRYAGGIDATKIILDSEFDDARASISEAEAEREAAGAIQKKTQKAVNLATEQLEERERLQNQTSVYCERTRQDQHYLTNTAVAARQAANQKTLELDPYKNRISESFKQHDLKMQEIATRRRQLQTEAASKLSNIQAPPTFSGIDQEIAIVRKEIEIAREKMVQLTTENLVKKQERLKVAVTVAELALEKVTRERVAPAKAIYDSAQRNTKKAGIRLARLTVKAEIAQQRFEKASDNMAKTVAHRFFIEEKAELRRKAVSEYPGGIEVIEITSASELEAARVVSFQADAERNAALAIHRETEEAVRLAEEQLIEREKLENEAQLYHEQTLRDLAEFVNRVMEAQQAVIQTTQELAPQAHRILAFRQQAEHMAAKKEEQIQIEAAARLYVKQEPTKFSGIDRHIKKAEEKMQIAQGKMTRLVAQGKAHRETVEKATAEIKAEIEKESRKITHTKKFLFGEHATYQGESSASSQASADVCMSEIRVIEHEKKKGKTNNIYQYEQDAGVLATIYYAKIEAAAEIAVEAIEKAESKLSHQSQLYEHEKQEKQKKFQSIRQELKRLQMLGIQARQAVEEKIPNAGQFLVDDTTLQREVISFDKEARKKLIKKHEEVEAQLQAEQHAKKIKENQPIPRLALTAAQSRPLNPKESLDLILRYAWLAIIAQEHDIFHLTNPSISPERRIFLWDIMCIVSTHAPKAELSHSNHVRPGKKSLGHMQQFFSSNQYKNALDRVTNILNSNTVKNASVPMPAANFDLNNPALQTAAKAVTHLKGKAQNYLVNNIRFFTDTSRSTNDKRIEQDAEFVAFAKGVAAIETVAKSMGTANISTEMQEMRYEIRRQIISNAKQSDRRTTSP